MEKKNTQQSTNFVHTIATHAYMNQMTKIYQPKVNF